MIKIDLKAARLPLILYWAIFLAIMVLFAFNPDSMIFRQTNNENIFKSNFFYWSDFICPLLAVLCVIMQLGNTLEKRSFEFVSSLPETLGVIGRWCFTVFVLIFPVYFAGLLAAWLTEAQELYSFWELFYLSGANLAFYTVLSLVIMLVFRRQFYAFCITCGFMFADLAVGDKFLYDFSTFLNIAANTELTTVKDNRLMYYIISAAGLLFAVIFVKTKLLNRLNRLL